MFKHRSTNLQNETHNEMILGNDLQFSMNFPSLSLSQWKIVHVL